METETNSVLKSMLGFAKFATHFSKWISLVFIIIWVIHWILCWIIFLFNGIYPTDILDYVQQPTLVVLGFYFGTKMVENVSKGVCSYFYKKIEVDVSTDFDS